MKTCLLTAASMQKTIQRMVFQVLEVHAALGTLTLLGVGQRGLRLATQMSDILQPLSVFKLHLGLLDILRDKKNAPVGISIDKRVRCRARSVLLVDDVLNTGHTLACCCAELLAQGAKQVYTAVLIERSHKRYPIEANIVGRKLYTTLEEYIEVKLEGQMGVYLH